MEQSNDQSLRLAVLIDADNASRTAMRDVMAEIAVYGTPTIKRIYGDWTTPNMASWKPILLENAITPVRRFRTGVQRFRLHPSGHPAAGGGQEGHRHGGEEDAQSLHRGL